MGNLKKQFMFENRNVPYGYPVLQRTLADSEAKLEEVLEQDPLCFRMYKTTKGLVEGNVSFDDRSYLRFRV